MGGCPICGGLAFLPDGWMGPETINGKHFEGQPDIAGICECDVADEVYARQFFLTRLIVFELDRPEIERPGPARRQAVDKAFAEVSDVLAERYATLGTV